MKRLVLLAPLLAALGASAVDVSAGERTPTGPRRIPASHSVGASDTASVNGVPRQIRVFRLVHRDPADCFAVIQPLLSSVGTITISPKQKVLTVQDDEEHLRSVSEAIRQFDAAPRSYRVQVTFYKATLTSGETKPAPAPVQLRGMGKRLSEMLRYSHYSQLDDVAVTGEEGTPLSARMGGEFSIEFSIDGDPRTPGEIRLRNFRVSRIRKDERGGEVLAHVFSTTVNLKIGKPFILGATRDEQSRTALLIALNAAEVPQEP